MTQPLQTAVYSSNKRPQDRLRFFPVQRKHRASALPSAGLSVQIQSELHPNYCYCFATLRKKDSFPRVFVSIFALTVRGKALSKLIV